MSYYCSAQICLNGHAITSNLNGSPELAASFCSKCGSATISACPSCNAIIRGYYSMDNVVNFSKYSVPLYCHNCGKPYPWVEAALQATQEIINEDDDLFEDEKERMQESLPDILAETPKSNLAVVRMKKVALRCGEVTSAALRQFAIDFGCEMVKNQLGL